MASSALDTPKWAHLEHGADTIVQGSGASPSEAFENAARALTATVTSLDHVVANEEVVVSCEAPSLEVLFVDWLNAVIFEMATRDMLYRDFHVEIDGTALHAEMRGEKVDVSRHAPVVEPKGATFTQLKVEHGSDGEWTAQCVVDL